MIFAERFGTGQQYTVSIYRDATAVHVAAQGVFYQRFGHQEHSGHGVCLTFAQIQTLLKLLQTIAAFQVIFPVKTGGIVQWISTVDKDMADFMGQDKPSAAVFGGTLEKRVQNDCLLRENDADLLVLAYDAQWIRAVGDKTDFVPVVFGNSFVMYL